MIKWDDTDIPFVDYASFWRRFFASLLDGLFMAIIAAIMFGMGRTPITFIVLTVIQLAYEVLLIHFNGATLGKSALSIKVISVNGKNPSLKESFFRTTTKSFSGLILLLGYFWYATNDQKQTWHDIAADTIVINDNKLNMEEEIPGNEVEYTKGRKVFKIIAIVLGLLIFIVSSMTSLISDTEMFGLSKYGEIHIGSNIISSRLYDINQDGKDELIFLTGDNYNHKLEVYTWDSSRKYTKIDIPIVSYYDGNVKKQYIRDFEINDIDKDGALEIIAGEGIIVEKENPEDKDDNEEFKNYVNVYRLKDNNLKRISTNEFKDRLGSVHDRPFYRNDFKVMTYENEGVVNIITQTGEYSGNIIRNFIYEEGQLHETSYKYLSDKEVLVKIPRKTGNEELWLVDPEESLNAEKLYYNGDKLIANELVGGKMHSSSTFQKVGVSDIDEDGVQEIIFVEDSLFSRDRTTCRITAFEIRNNKLKEDFVVTKNRDVFKDVKYLGNLDINGDNKKDILFLNNTVDREFTRFNEDYIDIGRTEIHSYNISPISMVINKLWSRTWLF